MRTESQKENPTTEGPLHNRRSFKWSGAARSLVRENQGARGRELHQLLTKLQVETGYPRRACRSFVKQFGLRVRAGYNKWLKADQEELVELLEQNTVPEIARIMQRSPKSVYGMVYRLGRSARMSHDWFTIPSLAEALRVSLPRVRIWVRQGWLKATHKKEVGCLTWTVIKPDDFADFCKNHGREVVGNRLDFERLEFVYKFVFPPSHTNLLSVRESKKERAAFKKQIMNRSASGAGADQAEEELEPEDLLTGEAAVSSGGHLDEDKSEPEDQ